MVKRHIQFWLSLFFLLFFSFFNFSVFSHGFHKDTVIRCSKDYCKKTIFQRIEEVRDKENHTIASYNPRKTKFYHWNKEKWVEKAIKAGGYSRTPVHCILSFIAPDNPSKLFTVTCTPLQNFYRVSDNTWVPVYQLKKGDRLLALHDKHIQLDGLEVIQKPLDVYTIQVKDTHVFLVTEYGLVTHNFAIPMGLYLTISAACGVGSVEGAAAGSFFGPIGVSCGAVVGGIVGSVAAYCMRNKVKGYSLSCGAVNTLPDYGFSCGGANVFSEYELRSCGGMKTLPDYGLPCGGGSIFPEYEQLPCGGANIVLPDYGYSCGAVNRFSDYPLSCGGSNVSNLISKSESVAQGKKFPSKAPQRQIGRNEEESTNKAAGIIAEGLGYVKTKFFSGKKAVFKKGNRFITNDDTCHKGGYWKMADSLENLGKKETRMGTYDKTLKIRIGD